MQLSVFYSSFMFDSGIECLPDFKFGKGDMYLKRWWHVAKKWGLLCEDLKALDRNSTALGVSINSPSKVAVDTHDVPTPDAACRPISDPANISLESLLKVTGNALVKGSAEQQQEGQSAKSSPWESQRGSALEQEDQPAPLKELYKWCRRSRARLICIGDAHGCIEEVKDLLVLAKYQPGDLVLFLGESSAAIV